MTLKQYASRLVTCSVAGIPISGYADGEFLRIEVDGEGWGDVQGADGEVARFEVVDVMATATLTLLASSKSNDALSALYRRDKLSPSGEGVGAFEARDNSGTSSGKGPQCWVMNQPTKAYAKELGTVEWKIRIANYSGVVGGNNVVAGIGN